MIQLLYSPPLYLPISTQSMLIIHRVRFVLAFASLFGAVALGQESQFDNLRNTEQSTTTPMQAEQAAASIELPAGFQSTLFASEPMVRQPISMSTDVRGRLWVGENYTYSEQAVNYDANLRDRIVIMEDSDNDGKADNAKVFYDQAERLTSIEVSHDGVWAICLPQLLFIPDRNHDDKPDGPPEVILDGFEYMRARHTVASGLRWGPDGWLYGRQGILGTSMIGPPGTPNEQRTEVNVGIWRYHPKSKRFEIVARGTTNPWGMDWDANGEAFFINTVIGHLWHVIPGAHYRRMFGDDADPYVYELIEQHADHVHWASSEVWTDVRKGVTDATLAAGGGHAHTGLHIYQGGQWPEYWNGKLLTINFHGRRLNVERLDREGSGFVGKHEKDAFMFGDPWFRGIDLIAAPDGSLFVSDWSDTGECHDHDGIHRTSGRIFQIKYGKGTKGNYDLTKESWSTLIDHLQSSNEWLVRRSRTEMLGRTEQGNAIGKQDLDRVSSLIRSKNSVHQLRALWALNTIGKLTPELLHGLMLDANQAEPVRAWALRFMFDSEAKPADVDILRQAIEKKTTPGLRLAAASVLQRIPVALRAKIAEPLLTHVEDSADHNLPLVLWYGIYPIAELRDGSFERLIASASIPTVQRLGMRLLAEDIDLGAASMARIDYVLNAVTAKSTVAQCEAILAGIAEGLSGRRQAPKPSRWDAAAAVVLTKKDAGLDIRVRDLSAAFGDGRALDQVRVIALKSDADLKVRASALQLLIEMRDSEVRAISEKLLPIRDLSATAAMGLALSSDDQAADLLLNEWQNLYGHERGPVASVLVARPSWARKFLAAIESGKLHKSSISSFQAKQIASYYDAELTQQLVRVWGPVEDESSQDRAKTIEKWKSEFTLERLQKANLENGRAVFKTTCASCHILNGDGGAIGPELTGAARDNLDYLLDNVLFPSAIVPDVYRQSSLRLEDGRVLTGIIRSRNRKSLKLQTATELLTVANSEIEEEKQSNLSIMPNGVLDTLTPDQRADLIGYLMNKK